MSRWIPIFLAVALTMLIPARAARADDEETLKERFESRYPTLVQLKDAGKIGETSTGFADPVDARYLREKIDDAPGSATIESFLGAENADRKKLYVLIAKRTSSTPEDVATRNAKRVFGKALPHHYLKLPSGKWVQKKDLKARSAY